MSDAPALRVRSFLGVKRADIDLAGINLIGGKNGAGKSSLLEGAACALLQVQGARGVRTKKGAADLVYRGAEEGSVSIEHGAQRLRIRYPAAEIEQVGPPVEPVTRLASGLGSFLDLDGPRRMNEVTTRFSAQPERQDLYQFLSEHSGTQGLATVPTDQARGRTLLDEATDKLFERCTAPGWDAVYKTAREDATKLKGRWEQTAGRRFGEKIAANWVPDLMLPGEKYSLESQGAEVQRQQAKLDELMRAGGMIDADRARLREISGGLDAAEQKASMLTARSEAINADMSALVATINQPDAPIDTDALLRCPSCKCYLRTIPIGSVGASGPAAYTGFEAVQVPSAAPF